MDMIAILGSLNMDLVALVERFPKPGETLASQGFHSGCGGKGANQAVAVARMGCQAAMLGAVGDDASGSELVETLRTLGVDTSAVLRRTGVPTGNALILLNSAGQNQIVISPGANATLTPADVRSQSALIARSHAVIAQLETPLDSVVAAFELARQRGIVTVLNPAPARTLDDAVLNLCDWIILNELEATLLSGSQVQNPSSAAAAAQAVRRRAPRASVIITLGAQGAWIGTDSVHIHQPAFVVPVVDTVSAGDAFVGSFVAELTQGVAVPEAARFACAAAALTVTRQGALHSIPHRAEARAFLEAVSAAEA